MTTLQLIYAVAGALVTILGLLRLDEVMVTVGQKPRAVLLAVAYSGIAGLLFLASGLVHAREIPKECHEAAGMLENLVKYRDGGGQPGPIMDRFAHDIYLARSVPPKLRWFVETEEDAQLLYKWIVRVFENEEDAPTVRFKFMVECTAGAES